MTLKPNRFEPNVCYANQLRIAFSVHTLYILEDMLCTVLRSVTPFKLATCYRIYKYIFNVDIHYFAVKCLTEKIEQP